MTIFKQNLAEKTLRLTLGGMYVYSGLDLIRHPENWTSYVALLPDFLLDKIELIGVERFLFIQGVGELVIAAIFILWFMPRIFVKIAALLAAIEMASILFFIGVDSITFRDVGLLGSSLAIFILARK